MPSPRLASHKLICSIKHHFPRLLTFSQFYCIIIQRSLQLLPTSTLKMSGVLTESNAGPSGARNLGVYLPPLQSTVNKITLLLKMPQLRQIKLREGHKHTKLERSEEQAAVYAQTVGQVANPACEHCKRGHGPWTLCITVPGFYKGSCANCAYSSSGNRCSFRSGKLIHLLWVQLPITFFELTENRIYSRRRGSNKSRPEPSQHPNAFRNLKRGLPSYSITKSS